MSRVYGVKEKGEYRKELHNHVDWKGLIVSLIVQLE